MNNTHIHFHYLQQKLQEWKANDLLFPPLQLSWMRFQEVATRDILPVLHEARAILEAEGLDVSIGAVSILRNVNMELPAGKFTGLVGRNGAGKTTLMRAVMGILKTRNGSIHFDAATLDTLPTYRRARAAIEAAGGSVAE